MILASAQTKPKRGDIEENLLDHYRLAAAAAEQKADLIVFPEMSITGYEREDAERFAFTIGDARLDKLRDLSANKNISIVAGAPIKIGRDLFIGSFIIFPDRSVSIYTKQYLHPGEEIAFKPSFDHNPVIRIREEIFSPAICADIDIPLHPEAAYKSGSTVYIPSIFFSPQGIPDAYTKLSGYAKKYSMNVLMSNFCGETWGRPSGGRSAFWNKNGELITALNDSNPGLLIVKKQNDVWTGEMVKNID